MSYTKLGLLQDLADMGLTGQETILLHSSMKSIGPVDGGADTVLDYGKLLYIKVNAPQLAGGYRSWFRAVHVGHWYTFY